MATKFIRLLNGNYEERVASVTSSASLDNLIATDPVTGKIDPTMMPSGIGSENFTIICSEALSANDMINIYNNAGVPTARKADASAANQGKTIDGYVKAAFTNGSIATIFTDVGSILSGFTGLVAGDLFLAAGGLITATVPTTAGHARQKAGKAISATQIIYRPDLPTTLA